MPGEKKSSGTYETFDSGDGPTVPEDCEGDFAHNDANPSDQGVEDQAVPQVPQGSKS